MTTPALKRAATPEEKAQKKELILSIALSLLKTKPYDLITMNEVALGAKVAKGTLFNYFETKEDLFLWVFLSLHEDFFHHIVLELESIRTGSITALTFFHSFVSSLEINAPYLSLFSILHTQLEPKLSEEVSSHYKKRFIELNHTVAALSSERFPELSFDQATAFYHVLPILIIGCLHICTPDNFSTRLRQLIEFYLYAEQRLSKPSILGQDKLQSWLL